MILYEHPFSPFAQKVKIALREKGLVFEARVVTGAPRDDASDPVNPRGEVPALLDNDAVIFEATAILEYLEREHPLPPLRPLRDTDWLRAQMIEDVCDTHYESINWSLTELRFFSRGTADARDSAAAHTAAQTRKMHHWLDAALQADDFLAGPQFGWADLSAFPLVLTSALFDLPPPPGSRLASWYHRSCQRDSVAKTIDEVMAVLPFMTSFGASAAAPLFRRPSRLTPTSQGSWPGSSGKAAGASRRTDIRLKKTAAFLGQHVGPRTDGDNA